MSELVSETNASRKASKQQRGRKREGESGGMGGCSERWRPLEVLEKDDAESESGEGGRGGGGGEGRVGEGRARGRDQNVERGEKVAQKR